MSSITAYEMSQELTKIVLAHCGFYWTFCCDAVIALINPVLQLKCLMDMSYGFD